LEHAYLGLGISQLAEKNYAEAVAPLEAAVKLQPGNPAAHQSGLRLSGLRQRWMDGWTYIYLVNSEKCDFYNPTPPLRNALYRNNRDGTFTDDTEKAGVGAGGYGHDVAVGDYDGDGFLDIYVTQCGRSILYHNNGDGTFTDMTEKAGVAAPRWTSSAVWFDYDNHCSRRSPPPHAFAEILCNTRRLADIRKCAVNVVVVMEQPAHRGMAPRPSCFVSGDAAAGVCPFCLRTLGETKHRCQDDREGSLYVAGQAVWHSRPQHSEMKRPERGAPAFGLQTASDQNS
jgi:hypothetical protein